MDHSFSWTKNPYPARVLLSLQRLGFSRTARLWSSIFGVDAPGLLPSSTMLPHPYSIVIASGARIGERCVLYQGVTIGGDGKTGVPTLQDDVVVFPGCCIIGSVTIGRGSQIGANSVVNRDVPPGSTVAGAPARVLAPRPSAGKTDS